MLKSTIDTIEELVVLLSRLLVCIGTLLTLLAAGLALASCSGPVEQSALLEVTLISPDSLPTSTFSDPVLQQGEADYNQWCGHCHGYNGEGQIAASIPRTLELGMRIVPPHDSTGHTWRHPDQLLILSIQRGVQNPLNQFQMPAFEGTLSEERIVGMLEYIKLWWTDEQRAHQTMLTERWTEMDAELGIVNEALPDMTPTPH
jgi:mono/diheme cytochrome c family protein